MSSRAGSLRNKVVVLTGASSGVGRAAAVEFAGHECDLVLAARREEDLEETARLCRDAGGTAIVVVTDVTREADVQNLFKVALEAFGRIDVWVNNAGVTLFALLAEAPFEEHQRVIETNLFGAMYASREVIPLFKTQGYGVLINVGSVLSKVAQPFVPSYVISKFALRGLSEVLRSEVAEHPGVHVCTLYPFVVDTPHFEEGANVRGKKSRPVPQVQSPEKVARALVDLAARPRREVHVPHIAVLGIALHWLLPRTTERLLLRALTRWHFDERAQAPTDGNLHAPKHTSEGTVHGHRGAQLGTAAFMAWSLRELGYMGLESASRVLRQLTGSAPPAALSDRI